MKEPKNFIARLSGYNRIRYRTEDAEWLLDYEDGKWVLSNREFYEVRWFPTSLDERAKSILKDVINPVVYLLNLKENDYSLETDKATTILERFATKVSEKDGAIKDEKNLFKNISFKKNDLTIELREYDRLCLDYCLP